MAKIEKKAMIFFRLTQDKTLNFTGENCLGGKFSKKRIAVFAFAHTEDTEKKWLLLIRNE